MQCPYRASPRRAVGIRFTVAGAGSCDLDPKLTCSKPGKAGYRMHVAATRLNSAPALCLLVTAGLVLGSVALPSEAVAAPAAPASAQEEKALADAHQMFEKGRAKYQTFDYGGAIDLWQQAYAKVPEDRAGVRNAMVYNIALAQEKAYELDKDVAHLRQAVLLLESWVKRFKTMYKVTPETTLEVDKAESRIADLKLKIGQIERGEAPVTPQTAVAPTTQIEFDSGYNPPPQVRRNRARLRAENRSEGLIAAGWTVGGIGVLIVLAGGAAVGAAKDRDASVGGAATLAFGASLVATGGILLGIGYKKRKRAAAGDYTFVPSFGPRYGGAAFSMRF